MRRLLVLVPFALLVGCGGGGLSSEQKMVCQQAAKDAITASEFVSASLHSTDPAGVVTAYTNGAQDLRNDVARLPSGDKVRKSAEVLEAAMERAAAANRTGVFDFGALQRVDGPAHRFSETCKS